MRVAIVIDGDLPLGLAANAAAALAFSVSPLLRDCVGSAVPDASGDEHLGITNIPLPVLSASASAIAELRKAAVLVPGVSCIDFSDIARKSKNYADYAAALKKASPREISYLGVLVYGEDRGVRSLTGSMPLLGK